jgi:hypothetical protein
MVNGVLTKDHADPVDMSSELPQTELTMVYRAVAMPLLFFETLEHRRA